MRLFKTNKKSEALSEAELVVIYNANREALLDIAQRERTLKLTIKDLQFAFRCLGRDYFVSPPNMNLSLERTGMLQDYFMYINTGMSGGEWTDSLNTWATLLNSNNDKKTALMGALNVKMVEMNEKVFHTELLYNIMALLHIREDENPLEFNQKIHEEKIADFKRDVANVGSYFFFHQTELKQLNAYLKLSEAEWTTLWHDSERQQMTLRVTLDYINELAQKTLKDVKTSKTT